MPRITKDNLDRWAECNAKAAELRRQASTLTREADAIETIAEADLTASGKDAITRAGYRLEMIDGKTSVSWKSELVARLGAEVADEITSAAPAKKSLQITPPKTAA